MKENRSIAIIGTVGVPANYGGFETLAENLVRYHDALALRNELTVYCSSKSYQRREGRFLSAKLKYIPLGANGSQSVLYDIISLISAVWNRNDVILVLGVSGAIALPFVRTLSSANIITNIDGLEWRRDKWRGLAKMFLRVSERLAVRFSHEVIADNAVIADYVMRTYGVDSHVIAYGGDHAMTAETCALDLGALPTKFAFSVCRIEPENNVHMILDAFSRVGNYALVMVGNWNNGEYGRKLRERYASCPNLTLLDPIYELGTLKMLRSLASIIVHGHSAGGTNPSLVEAMHFGKAILAFDCGYNHSTTENRALFFKTSEDIVRAVKDLEPAAAETIGLEMREIARRRYTWHIVAKQYFALLAAANQTAR